MGEKLKSLVGNVGARDLFAVSGFALLTAGVGMVYVPAAPIVAGVLLLAVGIFGVPSWP